jgi:hypothetical protein
MKKEKECINCGRIMEVNENNFCVDCTEKKDFSFVKKVLLEENFIAPDSEWFPESEIDNVVRLHGVWAYAEHINDIRLVHRNIFSEELFREIMTEIKHTEIRLIFICEDGSTFAESYFV